MTIASDIISAAYRESNLIPLGATPNANQVTEGLSRLNTILLTTVGFEAGDELFDFNYGGEEDEAYKFTSWAPYNARAVLNLSTASTITLDPNPKDGQRFAVVDAAGNLSTYNLTIDGNGRKIEGSTTLVLNTNGESRQWLYRADTGNWVRVNTLAASDSLPFPSEFDDYFIIRLAMRLNPMYGQVLTMETMETFRRIRTLMRARYRAKETHYPNYVGLLGENRAYWEF